MENKSVFQANLFAFILLLLYAIAPSALVPLFKRMNISSELYIVLPQILLLLIPTIIYFMITRKPIKDTLKLKKNRNRIYRDYYCHRNIRTTHSYVFIFHNSICFSKSNKSSCFKFGRYSTYSKIGHNSINTCYL